MFLAKSILLLVYRNLVAAIDRIFLVWQIAFPVVYIFVAGYAYSAMLGDQAINRGSSPVTYTSFLTSSIIGFNVINGSIIAGAIVWNDKRNGTLQQLLVMPFSRVQILLAT
jgi:ABC-2 type transport system permease protein